MRLQVRLSHIIFLAGVASCTQFSVPAFAQAFDTGAAQGAMFSRINSAVNQFARRIGVDDSLISYCRAEMHLHTRHKTDGFIPFGVNYNKIRSQAELDTVIEIREAYERNFLMLCLARAKRDLDAVLK